MTTLPETKEEMLTICHKTITKLKEKEFIVIIFYADVLNVPFFYQ